MTSSVTGCSTWRRVLTSRKEIVPSAPTRNSHGAGADVAGFLQDGLRRRVQLLVLVLGQERGGGLLDQLLVAALQRAVTGGDDDDVAVGVGQALGLHVPGLVEVALDEALAAAERGDGLADRRVVQLGDLLQGAGDLQAAPAAAEGGLDRDRQAVLLGERHDLVRRRRPGRGCRRRAGRRRAGRCAGRRPCRRGRGWPAAAGRSRSDPRPGRPARTPRSPTGSRSRGGSRPRRSPSPPGAPWPCPDSWRPECHRPGRTPRRPRAHAERPGPDRRRRLRSPIPASRQARATRTAISPRLAMSTLRTMTPSLRTS